MDEAEEEKVQLLESLRLQDAALSATVGSAIVALESDSDDDGENTAPSSAPVPAPCYDSSASHIEEVQDEDDTSTSQEANNQPSWSAALSANLEYDAVLEKLESEMKQNLYKVSKRLEDIQEQISSMSNVGPSVNIKSHWIYVFGMPYFKDRNFYPCPFNADYHRKKANKEICWSDLPDFHQWTPHQKNTLSSAIKKLSFVKCEKQAQYKLAVLRKDLDAARQSGNDDRASAISKQIDSFDVKAKAQSMLNDEIENGEHDWMLISAKYLEGRQSSEGCRSFWYMYMHPKFNKGPYTEQEEKKLISLAEKYKQQDWEAIAQELGTNRSGYQCFIVYQNKLNTALKKNNWSPEEDEKLLDTVEKYRKGNFIPWGKVAYIMDGRTKTQVFNRWTYSINPEIRKGRFSKEEDIMILVGVQMWGEDFQRISNFMKERTTSQIRDRYKQYLNRPGLGVPWTVEDDTLLLSLTEKHGKKWAKISQHFPTKDRTQVRHRYTTLMKWRTKNPSASLVDAPSRCYNPEQYRNFNEDWEKAKSILGCQTVAEMVKAKETLMASFLKRKAAPPQPYKKKKMSIIQNDLVNYFRCSFDIPGGRRKMQLRVGEAKKHANELKSLLSLLKAKLNLPSIEELRNDSSITSVDKEILKAFLSNESQDPEDSISGTPSECEFSEGAPDVLMNNGEHLQLPLFCDVKPSISSLDLESGTNIDYVPTHDIDSLYVNLPVLNFNSDAVVADRNQDPTFFEPPTIEPSCLEGRESGVSNNIPDKKSYVCPPNLTTLVGLRTYLLNRRTLLTYCNQNLPDEDCLDEVNNSRLDEAKQKFDERILCLFLWPALMSRYGPNSNSSIFLDDEVPEVPIQKDSVPSSISETLPVTNKSNTLVEVIEAAASSSNMSLKPIEEVIVDAGPSEPPKKRQRLITTEDSDCNSNDSDEIVCDN